MTYLKLLRLLPIVVYLLCNLHAQAHSSWRLHANDMYDVFGFKQTSEITEWMRYISSDMIDGYNKEKIFIKDSIKVGFYDYLKYKFPKFKCKHRLLFHWGYSSNPFTPQLQSKVECLHWNDSTITAFKQTLIEEQARRNRIANEKTELLFGFNHQGKEARIARFFISITYDVHILGDYTPDNKDLDGLCSLSSVVGDIINNLRNLDNQATKKLVKDIMIASKEECNDQLKAENILLLLKRNLRQILRNHKDSRINSLIVSEDFNK